MQPRRHPVYWFDDASVVLHVEDDLFKIHGSLFSRHSPLLATLIQDAPIIPGDVDHSKSVALDPRLSISSSDMIPLLEHVYHDE